MLLVGLDLGNPKRGDGGNFVYTHPFINRHSITPCWHNKMEGSDNKMALPNFKHRTHILEKRPNPIG